MLAHLMGRIGQVGGRVPADTFAAGTPSGAWLWPDALGAPQFLSQPVQGVSALWPVGDGDWFALSDNGYGTKANSSDYLLRVYRLAVEWGSTASGGRVSVHSFVQLADPDRRLPFPITRGATTERFTFPFITAEAVWPLAADEIVLANDNNFRPAAAAKAPRATPQNSSG